MIPIQGSEGAAGAVPGEAGDRAPDQGEGGRVRGHPQDPPEGARLHAAGPRGGDQGQGGGHQVGRFDKTGSRVRF